MAVERHCDTGCGRVASTRDYEGHFPSGMAGERIASIAWYCRECAKATLEAKRAQDPTRDARLQAKYGLNSAQWEQMRVAQGGLCWICQEPPGVKGLVVDHCHETGNVRGLLCGRCNSGIGMFKDDVPRIERAIEYLTRTWTV